MKNARIMEKEHKIARNAFIIFFILILIFCSIIAFVYLNRVYEIENMNLPIHINFEFVRNTLADTKNVFIENNTCDVVIYIELFKNGRWNLVEFSNVTLINKTTTFYNTTQVYSPKSIVQLSVYYNHTLLGYEWHFTLPTITNKNLNLNELILTSFYIRFYPWENQANSNINILEKTDINYMRFYYSK